MKGRLVALVAALFLIAATNQGAVAQSEPEPAPGDRGLSHWWQRMRGVLDEIAEAKRIVPPTPVKVRWQPRKIWEERRDERLSGVLVDLVAADLDGDQRSELYALTTKEVVMLSRSRGLYDLRTRVPMPLKPASQASRDPIGSLVAVESSEGAELRARTSEQSEGAVYGLVEGDFVAKAPFANYPLCPMASMEAAPGRNYFLGKSVAMPEERQLAASQTFYSARCAKAVDPTGQPLHYWSEVATTGTLRILCQGVQEHCKSAQMTYQGVGYAHLVADVDNDGFVEVLTSGSGVPGGRDSIVVYTQRGHKQRMVYDKVFAGAVVAIAAGDFDGDKSLEVVAAVRESGRVSLWLLN